MQTVVSKTSRAAVFAGNSKAPCLPRLSKVIAHAQKDNKAESKEASSLKLYSVAPREYHQALQWLLGATLCSVKARQCHLAASPHQPMTIAA